MEEKSEEVGKVRIVGIVEEVGSEEGVERLEPILGGPVEPDHDEEGEES